MRLTNPVKVKHRAYDEMGELTRFEYDANIIGQFWATNDKEVIIRTAGVDRMLIVGQDVGDYAIQIMDPIAQLVNNTEIDGLPKNTLTEGSPIYFGLSDTESLEFYFADDVAFSYVAVPSGAAEEVNEGTTGLFACIYRQFKTKHLCIDIPIFSDVSTSSTKTQRSAVKIKNLLNKEQKYRIFTLKEI
jgi:hypothetical protein